MEGNFPPIKFSDTLDLHVKSQMTFYKQCVSSEENREEQRSSDVQETYNSTFHRAVCWPTHHDFLVGVPAAQEIFFISLHSERSVCKQIDWCHCHNMRHSVQ